MPIGFTVVFPSCYHLTGFTGIQLAAILWEALYRSSVIFPYVVLSYLSGTSHPRYADMRLLLAAYSLHMPFPAILDCLKESPVSEQMVYSDLVILKHFSAHGVWYIAIVCMNNISVVYTRMVLVANFTGVLALLLMPPQWHQQWYSHCVYQAWCVVLDIMPMLFEV